MPEEHSFNKPKLLVSIAFVIIVVLGAIWFFSRDSSSLSAHEMVGASIIEVKDNTILVEGMLTLSSGEKVKKQIEVVVTEETAITKTTLVADLSISPEDQPYTPQRRTEGGNIADLRVGTHINMLKSLDNMYKETRVVAEEISYINFSYENKPE